VCVFVCICIFKTSTKIHGFYIPLAIGQAIKWPVFWSTLSTHFSPSTTMVASDGNATSFFGEVQVAGTLTLFSSIVIKLSADVWLDTVSVTPHAALRSWNQSQEMQLQYTKTKYVFQLIHVTRYHYNQSLFNWPTLLELIQVRMSLQMRIYEHCSI